jgi:hypothetical protein
MVDICFLWYRKLNYYTIYGVSIKNNERPLKNVQFCPRSRKTKISTAGIHLVFRGLKFESDKEIGLKGAFFKGLNELIKRRETLLPKTPGIREWF